MPPNNHKAIVNNLTLCHLLVGRFAYFCPYANFEHTYSSKIVRLHLGPTSIGQTLDALIASNSSGRTIIDGT